MRVKVTECEYKEWNRRLWEQFINGINDQHMLPEIIKELTIIKNGSEIMSEEIKHLQKVMLENLKESKGFVCD